MIVSPFLPPAMGYLLDVQGEDFAPQHLHIADKAFFAQHHDRRVVIRRAQNEYGEFDRMMFYKQSGLNMPQLWVLVTRVTEQNYMVIPLWRGSAFWPTGSEFAAYDALGGDDACMLIARQAGDKGGGSETECEQFANAINAFAARLRSGSKSPNETVN